MIWIIVILAVLLIILLALDEIDETKAQIATVLVGIVAVVLGYEQWREARHEISMDKYYERLDIANRRRENGNPTVHEMLRHSSPEREEDSLVRMMLIYAELDNLEYVIEKYRLGYMRSDQACRGLRTFQSRCLSPEFRHLATQRVRRGDYNRVTREVVEKVEKAAALQNRTAPEVSLGQAPDLAASVLEALAADALVLILADRLAARLNTAWAASDGAAQRTGV